MPPLRIAFINPCGDIGGAERSLLLLLGGLDRCRYAPVVFCSARGRFMDALAAIDVPARVVSLGRGERFSRFSGAGGLGSCVAAVCGLGTGARQLLGQLRAARPDIIHTNGIKAHLIGGVCGRLLRRPVLWHVRDLVPEGRLLTGFRLASDHLPRRIIAISQAVAAQFDGCRALAHTRTVHNAVDLSRFQPARPAAQVRAELGIASETTVLAMVAHFTPWKGHLLFLDAMARLVQGGLPVAGLIVGGSIYRSAGHDDYETDVRAYCQELGLRKHVHFTGYQECVPDFLSAADILVHPPTRPEPFGRSVIEAMALGKPVVAAAAGGVLEIVDPGATGLLVPPGDAAGFTAAVRSLLADPSRRLAMGRCGQQRVAERFTPAAHVAQVERVYQELSLA
jgi:glycosyltransferase involved in cell wall biosynthesis